MFARHLIDGALNPALRAPVRSGEMFISSRHREPSAAICLCITFFLEPFGQLACPVPRGGFAPGRRYDHEYDSRRAGLEALNITERRDPGMLPIRRLVVNIK